MLSYLDIFLQDTQYLGWITAGILFLLLILRDLIRDFIKIIFQRLMNGIYEKLSGTRFLRRTALKRYIQALDKRYREIRVPFRTKSLILKDIYVPLKVYGAFTESKMDPIETLTQYPHLMITGSPGSGKSTLLKHILFSLFLGKLSGLQNQPIPILLDLNRMNDSDKSLFEELVEALNRNNFPNGDNFVKHGLKDGTIAILLDALDEVNSKERKRVIQEIKDLSSRYSNCRLIVTCRTAVYYGELNDIVDQTLEIAEFDDSQIRQYMSSWEGEMPSDKSIDQLMETLYNRPRIMELARNPLMLAIIAYLYCDTPHELPHSRTEFYRIATDVLLRQWKPDYKYEFTSPAKQSVLKHLALFNHDRAQQRDKRTMDYETIMKEIKKLLPSINLKDTDVEPVLAEIVERSNLITPLDKTRMEYQFAHLTLQEYYAAYELLDDQDGLIQRFLADPDNWREPVKLWCGFDHDSTKLIKAIYEKYPIMAFECLADTVKIDRELADTIIHEFENKFQKGETSELIQKAFGGVASNIRSSRGQDVFNFLADIFEKQDENPSIKQAAAMSLSITNLPQAAEVLAKYFNTIQMCRSALIRMGELAVPVLARECEGEDALQYILALQEIGTPSATEAIVPHLWDTRTDIALVAAWSLGNLMQSRIIEETLRKYKSTIPSYQETLDWVWEPFKEPENSSLNKICGRIAFILSNTRSIPDYLLDIKLDRRFSIPLCVGGLSDKTYIEIIVFHSNLISPFVIEEQERYLFNWDEIPGEDSDSLLNFLKITYNLNWVKNAKINKVNERMIEISSKKNSLLLELNIEKTNVTLTIDGSPIQEYNVKMQNDKASVYLQINESVLEILKRLTDTTQYLKSLDKKFHSNLIHSNLVEEFLGMFDYYDRKEQEKYLFNWDEIPGEDSDSLLKFLKITYNLNWVKNAKINKVDWRMIEISSKKNSLLLELNIEKTNVTLTIDGSPIQEYNVKMQNDKPSVYYQINESVLDFLKRRTDTPQYLKSMDKKLQTDLLGRFLIGKPTKHNWSDIFIKETFDFGTSVKSTSKCQIIMCIDSVFGYIIGLT